MSRNKFIDTKVGKVLTSTAGKSLIGLLPFGIGSMASNVLNKVNDSNPGETDSNAFKIDLIKILIYVILGVLTAKGVLNTEDSSIIKDAIQVYE